MVVSENIVLQFPLDYYHYSIENCLLESIQHDKGHIHVVELYIYYLIKYIKCILLYIDVI
jgi:hypothetical protein